MLFMMLVRSSFLFSLAERTTRFVSSSSSLNWKKRNVVSFHQLSWSRLLQYLTMKEDGCALDFLVVSSGSESDDSDEDELSEAAKKRDILFAWIHEVSCG